MPSFALKRLNQRGVTAAALPRLWATATQVDEPYPLVGSVRAHIPGNGCRYSGTRNAEREQRSGVGVILVLASDSPIKLESADEEVFA